MYNVFVKTDKRVNSTRWKSLKCETVTINVKQWKLYSIMCQTKKDYRLKSRPHQNQRKLEEKMFSFLHNQLFCGLNGEIYFFYYLLNKNVVWRTITEMQFKIYSNFPLLKSCFASATMNIGGTFHQVPHTAEMRIMIKLFVTVPRIEIPALSWLSSQFQTSLFWNVTQSALASPASPG